MTLSRRSFLAAAGGLGIVATATACGSNTGRGDATSNGSATGGPSLTQWYHEYGEDGVQAAVTKYAQAYPDAHVTVKWNPGEYEKLVGAALLTSTVPDVFEYANGPTLDMIKSGQVADLTDVIGSAKDSFNQAVLRRLTYNGKIYAIPQTVDMQLLYYRKSVLNKAGVNPPTTFAELVAAAEKVKTNKMGGFFAGNQGGLDVLATLLIWASGLEQLNSNKTDIGFADQRFYDALGAYREFYKSDALLKQASADWSKASAFTNEECAMQWGGLWSLPDVQQAFGDDFGVVAFPAIGSAGRTAVPFGAFSACVAAKGPSVDAAKKFVKWLWVDQEDKQLEFSDAFGTHIPAKPALAAKATKTGSGAGADAATMVSDHGFATDILWTQAMGDAYSTALNNIIVKGADPKSEIEAVSEKARAELKRVNG